MIRVNLLKGKPGSGERLEAVLTTGGASAFISRREAVLGGLFLLLGVAILATQVSFTGDADPEPPPELVAEAAPPESASSEPEPAVTPESEPAEPTETEAAPEPRPAETPPPKPPVTESARRPAAAAVADAGAGRVREVSGLTISPVAGGLEISLYTGARPDYSTFRLDNPKRIVFDLNGVVLNLPAAERDQAVGHPLVARIRIATNRFDPPRVRMVLEVPEFPKVTPEAAEDGLVLRISAAGDE